MKNRKLYIAVLLVFHITLFLACTGTDTTTTPVTNTDKQFRLVKTESIDHESNVEIEILIYDNENRLIEQEKTLNGERKTYYKAEYDDAGNMIKETQVYEDGYEMEIEYTYENGLMVKERWESVEGYGITTYNYDEQGREIFMEISNYTDEIIDDEYYSKKTFYDEEGRIVKEEMVESHGMLMIHYYEYNDDGSINEKRGEHGTGFEWSQKYTYNENGNILSKKYDSSDEIFSEEYYKYNEKYQLIEYSSIVSSRIDPEVYTAKRNEQYEYDNDGYMIKKVVIDEAESTIMGDSNVKSVYEYKYDENKNVSEIKIENTGNDPFEGNIDEKIIETYVYDEYNNLIKKEINNNGNITVISYFYEEY